MVTQKVRISTDIDVLCQRTLPSEDFGVISEEVSLSIQLRAKVNFIIGFL